MQRGQRKAHPGCRAAFGDQPLCNLHKVVLGNKKVVPCKRLHFARGCPLKKNCTLPIMVALFCFALSGSITTVLVHFALCTCVYLCVCVWRGLHQSGRGRYNVVDNPARALDEFEALRDLCREQIRVKQKPKNVMFPPSVRPILQKPGFCKSSSNFNSTLLCSCATSQSLELFFEIRDCQLTLQSVKCRGGSKIVIEVENYYRRVPF